MRAYLRGAQRSARVSRFPGVSGSSGMKFGCRRRLAPDHPVADGSGSGARRRWRSRRGRCRGCGAQLRSPAAVRPRRRLRDHQHHADPVTARPAGSPCRPSAGHRYAGSFGSVGFAGRVGAIARQLTPVLVDPDAELVVDPERLGRRRAPHRLLARPRGAPSAGAASSERRRNGGGCRNDPHYARRRQKQPGQRRRRAGRRRPCRRDRQAARRRRRSGAPGFVVAAADDRVVVRARRAGRAFAARPCPARDRGSCSPNLARRARVVARDPGPERRRRARALRDLGARLLRRIGLAPLALERDRVLLRAGRVRIDEDPVFLRSGGRREGSATAPQPAPMACGGSARAQYRRSE